MSTSSPGAALAPTQLASALIFFVLARYRMPVVPFLAIFAGAGAVALFDALRARSYAQVLPMLATLAAAVVVVHWPVGERENLHMAHFNLANRYRALGRWELAARHYWNSLEWTDRYLPAYSNLALTYPESGTHRREAIVVWTHLLRIAERDGFPGYAERARNHLEELGAGDHAGD